MKKKSKDKYVLDSQGWIISSHCRKNSAWHEFGCKHIEWNKLKRIRINKSIKKQYENNFI